MNFSDATPVMTFRSVVPSLAAASLLAFSAATAAKSPDTYDWSALLVSIDESNGTAEFQARFESYVDINGLDGFSKGDRLTLVWTGRNWAAGIRDLAVDPDVEPAALTLPVEFVSTARDETFLNFRVHVPEAAMHKLAAMEEGARVTVYSPKAGADWESAVVSLHHYNEAGAER